MSKRKIVSLYSFAASNTVLSTDGQQVSDGKQMLTEMQRNVQPLQLSYAALPLHRGNVLPVSSFSCLCIVRHRAFIAFKNKLPSPHPKTVFVFKYFHCRVQGFTRGL